MLVFRLQFASILRVVYALEKKRAIYAKEITRMKSQALLTNHMLSAVCVSDLIVGVSMHVVHQPSDERGERPQPQLPVAGRNKKSESSTPIL